MNKQQFISYIDAPEKMSGADSILLNDLIKQFPYFQTAHLLYAKSLHNTQNIQYNNQLKTTAAYASDRKVLYQLITNKKDAAQDVNQILIAEQPIEEIIAKKIVKEEVEQSNIKIEVKESIEEKNGELNAVEEFIEEKINEENVVSTISNSELEEEKSEEITPIEELEKEYLDNAAISVYSTKNLYELPTIEASQNETKEDSAEVIKELQTQKEPESFSDWLKNISSFEISENQQIESLINENSGKKSEKLSSSELIDKFIADAPRISKPKAEFFNPVNMAKQSVAEDISFVSETLAKIYELQGNYSKALASYESLRLKYPEKRLYFAAQIKNLKKLINQNNNK